MAIVNSVNRQEPNQASNVFNRAGTGNYTAIVSRILLDQDVFIDAHGTLFPRNHRQPVAFTYTPKRNVILYGLPTVRITVFISWMPPTITRPYTITIRRTVTKFRDHPRKQQPVLGPGRHGTYGRLRLPPIGEGLLLQNVNK